MLVLVGGKSFSEAIQGPMNKIHIWSNFATKVFYKDQLLYIKPTNDKTAQFCIKNFSLHISCPIPEIRSPFISKNATQLGPISCVFVSVCVFAICFAIVSTLLGLLYVSVSLFLSIRLSLTHSLSLSLSLYAVVSEWIGAVLVRDWSRAESLQKARFIAWKGPVAALLPAPLHSCAHARGHGLPYQSTGKAPDLLEEEMKTIVLLLFAISTVTAELIDKVSEIMRYLIDSRSS